MVIINLYHRKNNLHQKNEQRDKEQNNILLNTLNIKYNINILNEIKENFFEENEMSKIDQEENIKNLFNNNIEENNNKL